MMAQARETGNNNNIKNATSLSNATSTNAATSTAPAISGTTTFTMVQGSQNPSNEQFYNPSEVTVFPGSTVILKNQDTPSIHPPQVRMLYLMVHLILDLLLQVSLVNQ
jgi:plastocyanin